MCKLLSRCLSHPCSKSRDVDWMWTMEDRLIARQHCLRLSSLWMPSISMRCTSSHLVIENVTLHAKHTITIQRILKWPTSSLGKTIWDHSCYSVTLSVLKGHEWLWDQTKDAKITSRFVALSLSLCAARCWSNLPSGFMLISSHHVVPGLGHVTNNVRPNPTVTVEADTNIDVWYVYMIYVYTYICVHTYI